MKSCRLALVGWCCWGILSSPIAASAATLHVWASSPSDGPGTDWTNAFHDIQSALDASGLGDTVLVTNGVYATSKVASENRIAHLGAVMIRSTGGPEVTFIVGEGPMGASAVRCAYLGWGAQLHGFTLTNGFTTTGGLGGGVRGDTAWGSAILSNCVITGCSADIGGGATECELHDCRIENSSAIGGGGTYSCTLYNCFVVGNRASSSGGGIGESSTAYDSIISGCSAHYGGGAYASTLTRCLITSNRVDWAGGGTVSCELRDCQVIDNAATNIGGGAWGGVFIGCLFAGNQAGDDGGGVNGGTLLNCTVVSNRANKGGGVWLEAGNGVTNSIIYHNEAPASPNWYRGTFLYSCTTPLAGIGGGAGCLSTDPRLVAPGQRNFRLRPDSPCIDLGVNQGWMSTAVDLDGRPRLGNGTVDMGAYESWDPVVTITNPVNGATFNNDDEAVSVSGSNNVFVVGTMWWTNAAGQAGGSFAAVTPWVIPEVPLAVTNNTIVVAGTNIYGVVGSCTVQVTRTTEPGGTVRYVSLTGGNTPPYTNWAMAARTIQAAVNVCIPYDHVIVTNGVYTNGSAVAPGSFLTNRVFVGQRISVRSVNGPAVTVIGGMGPRGDNAIRCAYLTNDARLYGFTLSNGCTRQGGSLPEDDICGGGVFASGSRLTNCVLRQSDAINGGGVYGGTLTACQIISNSAFGYGGGCANATVRDCTIRGNSAWWAGGARYCSLLSSTLADNTASMYGGAQDSSLDHCIITNNMSGWAGGVYACTLTNCLLVGNSSSSEEGGAASSTLNNCLLLNNHAATRAGGAGDYSTLTDCTLMGNTASYGGATFSSSLLRCLVQGNSATQHGGGCYESSLTNCRVIGNVAVNGGGVYTGQVVSSVLYGNVAGILGGGACYATLVNCTVVSNWSAGVGGGICGSQLGATETNAFLLNCIVYDNSAANPDYANRAGNIDWAWCCTVPMPAGPGNFTNNPGLRNPLAGDERPWGNSPCVDRGTNLGWMATARDVLGAPRIFGDRVDVGAYELVPVHYVATNAVPAWPFGSWATAAPTIQDAVDAAWEGQTVLVSNGVYSAGGGATPGASLTNRVCVTNAITLRSVNGPARTTIVGQRPLGATAVRGVYLGSGAVLDGFTVLSGATLTAGDVSLDRSGGGVYTSGGTLTNCIVSDCLAHLDGGGICGAYFYSGTAYSLLVTGNTAEGGSGGGVCRMTLYDAIVSNNTAAGEFAYGGGVCDCTLERGIITGNHSDIGGGAAGGVYRRCLIADNRGERQGGGLNNAWAYESVIDNNWSRSGGGSANGVLVDCRVTRNVSVGQGGGAYGAILGNCTVVSNVSESYAGGITLGSATNSIIYFNTAPEDADFRDTPMSFSCTPVNPGGNGNITNEPVLIHGAGGEIWLATNSPAINAGTNQDWMLAAVDVDGFPRVSEGRVDMGASETTPVHHVNPAAGNVWPYADPSGAAHEIQAAVDAARGNDTILVCAGIHSPAGEVLITLPVTLRGSGDPGMTVLNGSYAHRCVKVTGGGVVRDLTLTNGYNGLIGGGGAYLNLGHLVNCLVVGNGAVQGGGLYIDGAGLATNCTISGNTAQNGGGGYLNGGAIAACTLRDNTAQYGAGLYTVGAVTSFNCVITRNSAAMRGGGIYANGAGFRLESCTLATNHVDYIINSGSGLTSSGGGSLLNCILFHNTPPGTPDYFTSGSDTFGACNIAPDPGGIGNITNAPKFRDLAAGDVRLATNSPCIDAGTNQAWMSTGTDREGKPRLLNGRVDIGAHELIPHVWDSDADGLPDWWEWDYARTMTGLVTNSDNDADGFINSSEYQAGTDPTNAASRLELISITPLPGSTNGMIVRWSSVADHTYSVQRETNLLTGTFNTTVFSNVAAVAPMNTATDITAKGISPAFYRIRVQ